MQMLCNELGTEVAMGRLRDLVTEVKEPGADSVSFEDFLRVVALLLDEEAALGPEYSQAEQLGDDWQSDDAGDEGNLEDSLSP